MELDGYSIIIRGETMNIGRKIYYEKATGNVLVDTGERSGAVMVPNTIENDFKTYIALSGRTSETVGVKELSYGQFKEDFLNCNGYKINPSTLALEFSYPSATPEQPPEFREPLTVQIDKIEQEKNTLKSGQAQILLKLMRNNIK
jgi:hypothetical protein